MLRKFKVAAFVSFVAISLLFPALLGIGKSLAATAGGITRSNSGGGVTVNVTYPHSQKPGEARFDVVLDTHSVSLDGYDLTELSLLRDGSGTTYKPSRVENKGSGHHRETAVVFPVDFSSVKRLELVIRDIAGIKERTFLWELK